MRALPSDSVGGFMASLSSSVSFYRRQAGSIASGTHKVGSEGEAQEGITNNQLS